MTSTAPKIAFFCDEAGKDTDRYLAVGGVIVTHSDVSRIRSEFLRRKSALNLTKEAKWNSTKKASLEKHRALVHWIFSLIQKRELLFHCLLVDFQRFDHDLRTDGGKAESMKRMYYQLILHRLLKKHGTQYDCYALIDQCNELDGLPKLLKGLNSAARPYGCNDALKIIEFRDSQTEPLLQINDLLLGAICAHKNRRFEDQDAGIYKANLAGYVLGQSGLPHYDADTPKTATDFSIWNLDSKHLKGGAGT
ncbi:DUF3800 domain-containing protein [Sphingopyxis sp. Geo48]|uniref:DUF3800 domain-containing protein n=1 Tax=Sphingopyxis sp. Geo48 TaxID=545241 RepID=UPI0024B642B7|nr:DUF3800 domain-containing protein [Sphingopyxis sp. Geo48]